MAEYLDKTGLTYLWSKIKAKFDAKADKTALDTKADKTTADALEKRIDNLILSSGSESSAEVIDARTGCDGTAYDTLGTAIRSQANNLNNDLHNKTNQIYNNNNLFPNPFFNNLNKWSSSGAGTFLTYKVNKYFNALRLATDGKSNPLAYTDISNVNNIRYFKMTTVGSNIASYGDIDVVGYPTKASSNGTNLFSKANIQFTSNNGVDFDVLVDMGKIDCSAYDHIRFIITFRSKTKTLLAYKMFLGAENENYSVILEQVKNNESEIEQIKNTVRIENPLYGKSLYVNGDSICYGVGNIGGYAKLIAERNNMSVHNDAVPGATIASGVTYSDGSQRHHIAESLTGISNSFDYYIIEGGFNDAGNNVNPNEQAYTDAISTVIPSDFNTTVGAMEKICYELSVVHHSKKVGFIFPHKIDDDEWKSSKNKYNYNWGDYKALQKKILKKWGIPYLDIAECGGLNTVFAALANSYTNSGDRIHPNENGYLYYYVPKIEAWLKTL